MTSTSILTGASLLFTVLQQHGVKDVFGYPGGAIMPIYDALYDSDINHFLCRHEQGAAFSTVGYSRTSGNIGVCMATSGPGATNLLTGLADAMADSIPVIAITGQVPTSAMGSDAFQEVDIVGMALACTKHCFQVRDVNDLANILHQAFEIALSGRQGPVLIDIPKDIQISQVTKKLDVITKKSSTNSLNAPDTNAAIELIKNAKKPILYVGGGVGMANAVPELREFMNKMPIPSVSTLKGLGAIDKNAPYYMGMLGMHGTRASNIAVQESDLLIAIGARFDDRVTGKLDEFSPNARVIHFDIDQAEINKRRDVDVAIVGDLKDNLLSLICAIDVTDWQQRCEKMRIEGDWDYNHPGENIYAPAVLKEISDKMPASAVVTTDVGQHQMWAAQHMSFSQPENFLTSGSLGTMGFGLPAAIGAQVSRKEDTVIAVTGDGSITVSYTHLTLPTKA